MTHYTTITSKGQITLPAAFRAKLKLAPGQRLAVRMNQAGQIMIDVQADIEQLSDRITSKIKSGIPPLHDVRAFYIEHRAKDVK